MRQKWLDGDDGRCRTDRKEAAMDWDMLSGDWKQFKGAVQERWGDLTDDDFDRIAGQREQFIGRVQERYGQTRDVAEREVDDFVAGLQEPVYR
jgi:uncharacterized protein YjbJ (UPF0337 family)